MQSGSKKVLQNLYKQKKCGTFCDVQIHLQGTILSVHACVLASCSPYFLDYLNNGSNEEGHWCTRKPLVIMLDNICNDGITACLICVSKIIDFMYLRELVVLQGHFQHFCEIAKFFKVLDLIPFCEKFKNKSSKKLAFNAVSDSIDKSVSNISEINHVGCNIAVDSSIGIEDTLHINKSNQNEKQYISVNVGNVNKQSRNEEITKTTINTISESTGLNNNTIKAVAPTNLQNENITEDKLSQDGDIIKVNSSKSCGFSCCNPDLSLPVGEKQKKKRKLSCESCHYSTVSIKRMVKHIQTYNHLKSHCPVCNLSVEHIKDPSKHLKDHCNSKPFICHICLKRSRFWVYHQLHLRVHCKNKLFSCEICQKRFNKKRNLSIHMLIHKYKHACKICNYFATDKKSYQMHLHQHSYEQSTVSLDTQSINEIKKLDNHMKQNKFEVLRKFQCYVCKQRFTQQKNLSRHIEVKHNNVKEYNCSMCYYLTKRYDLMRYHMKKHHNCLPAKETKKRKIRVGSNAKQNQKCPHKNGVVGVLIPVKLVSVDDNSTLNAFAVKARSSEISGNEENIQPVNLNKGDANVLYNTSNNNSFQSKQTQSSSNICKLQDYTAGNSKLLMQVEVSESTVVQTCPEELQSVHIDVGKENGWNCKANEGGSHFVEQSENIWLNEATGELLNSSSSGNVSKIDKDFGIDKNLCFDLRTEHSSLFSTNFENPFQSLVLNEAGGTHSFDLDDDRQSNPQTPQTNFMDFDSQDKMFTWESLRDNFCSTWVLNESTGELHMVNFNMQPFKPDEHTGNFSLIDDDETAQFLNEGTGDLSVIYFNPSKNYCENSNYFIGDQLNQDKLETMSQHSNDEDGVLNEEFLLASANFMARDENETFLNELTGEFDVAHYNNGYSSEPQQVLGKESIYLNEETGEISFNTVDTNFNNEILSSSDSVRFDIFDFEDSLCEDFEQFSTEINDFSSQFCLDNKNSNDWHNFDETCDTLLNECTGELVKRC